MKQTAQISFHLWDFGSVLPSNSATSSFLAARSTNHGDEAIRNYEVHPHCFVENNDTESRSERLNIETPLLVESLVNRRLDFDGQICSYV